MHPVVTALVEQGRLLGFDAVTGYVVPGGRIDVVWLWRSPRPIPGVPDPLQVVGFEVESSWRTRKHIKGDLINLQDLACSLGVIVLLGHGEDVESTRRFASQLVDRPGSRILVWSDRDVEDLVAERADVVAASPLREIPGVPPRGDHLDEVRSTVSSWTAPTDHTGKYCPCGHGFSHSARRP